MISKIIAFFKALFSVKIPVFENIKRGEKSSRVGELEVKAKRLGYYSGPIDDDFGPMLEKAIKDIQKDGGFLVRDGIVTKEVMAYIDSRLNDSAPKKTPTTDDFGAPWVFANIDMLGRKETDPVLNARFVPEWVLEGLAWFRDLIGRAHAWCSVVVNAGFRKVGIKGTNSAAAASWSSWGKKCPFWFGCVFDIVHSSGGRHVCLFLYWIDENRKIAATLDGNRNDTYGVFATDISGSGDKLKDGPRWPLAWPDGQFVTKEQVLAKYPQLKPISGGNGSTR